MSRRIRRARTARRPLALETLENRSLLATFVVNNVADSGPGSLRDAITQAEQTTTRDTINFNIAGGGHRKITLASALPNISLPVTINGWSQPGYAGKPLIEISAGSSGTSYGLSVFSSNSIFRGLIFNGFASASVAFWGADGNKLQGCYLNSNATATAKDTANTFAALYISSNNGDAVDNVIGTDGDGVNDVNEANILLGSASNFAPVVYLAGSSANNNTIAGNFIGTNRSGLTGLGGAWGIYFTGGPQQNVIGSNNDGVADSGEANLISGNRLGGIAVADFSSKANQISRNRIFGNGGSEIDLGADGTSFNDAQDTDTGPNDRVNFPVLRSLSTSDTATTVRGSLDAQPNQQYRLEFFAGTGLDDTGHGGAEIYLGSRVVTTNSSGHIDFAQGFGILRYGLTVSATATDSQGNTSEFSHAVWQGLDLNKSFALHSNPVATKVIYLDFDGHRTTGTQWNTQYSRPEIVTPAYSIDFDATFSDEELFNIQRIFQAVAEDMRPFHVNVTTEEPPLDDLSNTGSPDERWGIRVAIGGTQTGVLGSGNSGGIAYLGSFSWNSDTPAFVFEDSLSNGAVRSVALASSHEVGHTFNLNHDGGTSNADYYAGHGTGPTSWGPLMGAPYGVNVTQWSKGQYPGATNTTEDDLEIITTQNGFDYRVDDAPNNTSGAEILPVFRKQLLQHGIIERSNDVDVYALQLPAGSLFLRILPDGFDPNLDIKAELLNSNGQVLVSSNPAGRLDATLSRTVAAGKYYLRIDGVGEGDLTTGYSDYGSLGAYTITGTVPVSQSPEISNVGGLGSYTEDTAAVILASGFAFSDPDSTSFDRARLTVKVATSGNAADQIAIRNEGNEEGQVFAASGQVRYGGTAVGTYTGGNGTNSLVVTFNSAATKQAIQEVARAVTFRTVGDNPSTARRSITFELADGMGGDSNRATRFIDVVPVNDRPIVGVEATREFQENGAYLKIAPTGQVTDPDSKNFGGGKLRIGIEAGGENRDVLKLLTSSKVTIDDNKVTVLGKEVGTLSGGTQGQPLTILLNSNATPVYVTALIRHVAFRTAGDNPAARARTILFNVDDGDGGESLSRAARTSINVVAVNDAPEIVGGGRVIYKANTAPVAMLIENQGTITDPDSPNFELGQMIVSNAAGDVGDRITIGGEFTQSIDNQIIYNGVVIGSANAGGGVWNQALVINFNVNATPLIASKLARSIFFSTFNSSAFGLRSVTFQVTDGDGGTSNTITKTVEVTA